MMFHGDVSEALERSVSDLAQRYDMKFVVERITITRSHFLANGELQRMPNGELALLAAIRADTDLYERLKKNTDLFAEEEIEF